MFVTIPSSDWPRHNQTPVLTMQLLNLKHQPLPPAPILAIPSIIPPRGIPLPIGVFPGPGIPVPVNLPGGLSILIGLGRPPLRLVLSSFDGEGASVGFSSPAVLAFDPISASIDKKRSTCATSSPFSTLSLSRFSRRSSFSALIALDSSSKPLI